MKLTVTNSPFGLTIKFYCKHRAIIGVAVDGRREAEVVAPVNIQSCGATLTVLTVLYRLLWLLGDRSEGVPPVPIPNTEVKPLSPDGTARASVWESRTLPNSKESPGEKPGLFPSYLSFPQCRRLSWVQDSSASAQRTCSNWIVVW